MAELGLAELGLAALGLAELGLAELGFAELSFSELGFVELSFVELGFAEIFTLNQVTHKYNVKLSCVATLGLFKLVLITHTSTFSQLILLLRS